MTIMLERYTVPEKGLFEIDLKQSIDIQVTAEEARRKVNRWVHEYVSYMMHAEAPTLVLGEHAVWRVPAVLTATHIGTVGKVGTVDVDVYSGCLENLPERKEHILQCARELSARLPPYQPTQTLSEEFIPKHLPRARMLVLPPDEDDETVD